ncbi:Uma2 family endonuclease [Pseudanabaena sp. FACHB-1998]|uniref:Uma2 family endonuclease n=1 Tax=Pseudanabaena sp. FACHB-1998 TaxID=2692858 RepID=UPI0016812514|nr:Uma2 family endonuclease [Pseudanabaena sp. FACHB-1998]MBD2175477.1 Uma2 family endonuclease [Pseudanabaena sp. FACHB-1998]
MVVTVDRLKPTSPESDPNIADQEANLNNQTFVTLDEYRSLSETAEERLEYCNGEVFTMSGGTANHSAIAVNLIIYLGFLLRDTDLRIYNGDMRIWIPEFNCGTYADVLVIDGEPEFNENRTDEILNPLLIVEVLSPSTEGYDRGEKFRKYRSIPHLAEYLLISQSEPYIEHYSNTNFKAENRNIWQLQISDRLDQKVILPSLNIEIPLSEIYRRITGIE